MNKNNVYFRMLAYVKPSIHLFILSSILTFIVVALDGISLWFSGSLLHTIFNADFSILEKPVVSLAHTNDLLKYYTFKILTLSGKSDQRSILMVICILIPVLFLIKNIFLYAQGVTVALFNLSIIKRMRNVFYNHLLQLPIHFFDSKNSGAIISLTVKDLASVNSSLTTTLNKLLVEPLRIIFFCTLLLIINWKLTLIIFTIYPILTLVLVKTSKTIRRRSRRMLSSFSNMVSILTETIRGIRAVKMFNTVHFENKKFQTENNKFIKDSFKERIVKGALSPFTEVLAMSVTSMLLWTGGNLVLSGTSGFSSDDFIRFLIILFSSYTPLKKLTTVNSNIQSGIAAATRVFEVLDIKKEPESENQKVNSHKFEKKVEYKNVSFRYPNFKELVLKDLNFNIPMGKTVALVGSSGSGKSTILDLLPRFYDISNGEILIDGINIKDFSLKTLRNLFGIVSQETILFDDTVLRNITYGDLKPDLQKAQKAIVASNADAFINKLPLKLDTVIGEQGITLSGGQKQRLAIARALYCDPQILILDEATSSLDTESEQLVQVAINNLIKDRTSIVVAHRLSTIQHADIILVLENGSIIERGTHKELIKYGKRYKYLHNIQFALS